MRQRRKARQWAADVGLKPKLILAYQRRRDTLETMKHNEFKTSDDLSRWLEENHAQTDEVWVRIFKKASGKASVDWQRPGLEANSSQAAIVSGSDPTLPSLTTFRASSTMQIDVSFIDTSRPT